MIVYAHPINSYSLRSDRLMAANAETGAGTGTNVRPVLLPEIGPDGIAQESPIISYTEKIIEAEQLQLRKYIEENYTKIRDVERELANLTLEMKLTSGPKKAALEHMRKKIELSNEKIRAAKLKEEHTRKAWEEASKAVKDEEQLKQKLCEDLNSLVHESSKIQMARLEELKRRLDALNPSRSSMSNPTMVVQDGNPMGQTPNNRTQDTSSVAGTADLASRPDGNISNPGKVGNVPTINGSNQASSLDVEGRGKKKAAIQGRGKGVGAVPKGRSSVTPGWTGAGFDVDGRS